MKNDEIELGNYPNCACDAVGYDGTGPEPFLECFQCDYNWTAK
jgi:hypothetical protein